MRKILGQENTIYLGGNMNRKPITITFCLLSALILLSACASFGPQAGSFPTGTYVSKWNPDEYLILKFNKDGSFELIFEEGENQESLTAGTYFIDDDVIVWGLDPECLKDNAGSAAYYWSFEDDELTFEPIGEDDCQGRKMTMKRSWSVKP